MLPHDQSAHLDPGGFEILVVDAVIPYQGIGEGHHLSGVGRVGQDLLIAGHAGVEHHFANAVRLGAEANSFVDGTIFQDQIGWLVQSSAPTHSKKFG